ncbi:MAG: hypothetical protein WCG21_02540 [Eubacteriales bacterium]
MGHKLDRVIYEISVVYIALPIFIFLAGWLRPAVAIPACIIFLVSLFLLMKNHPAPISWHLTREKRLVVIVSIILLAVWVLFSGQGGFSFQNADYQYRNAIFRDLIEKSWPVIYNYNPQNIPANSSIAGTSNLAVLTYYIAFWLPGALFGKLFGWYAGNAFLYFWSLLGIVLIVYYLFRTLRNTSVWSVVILIFFSGLDILGYVIISGKYPGPIDHIEWWSGFQYSSNTTLLFWVFNQTITIWLAILLILNLKNTRSLFFLYAMLLLHGPFPFLGMLPIVLWKAYQGYPLTIPTEDTERKNPVFVFLLWFWNGVRRALSFENVFGGISVLLIIYLYLSNNMSAGKTGTNNFSFNYCVFVFFEGGMYLLFLYVDHHRKPLYWISLISLLLIPFFKVGSSQDFCMRVSIPALFMVQILIQQTLLGRQEQKQEQKQEDKQEQKPGEMDELQDGTGPASVKPVVDGRHTLSSGERKIIRVIFIILLVIGSVVPIQEISRSVVFTLPAYEVTRSAMISVGTALQDSGNPVLVPAGKSILKQSQYGITWTDSVKTLDKSGTDLSNFMGPVKDSFFYEYLARR